MPHPSEYLVLNRGDLLPPEDSLSLDRVTYVYIRSPKTARFARRQHSKLEDGSVISFLKALFGHLDFDARLYPGSRHVFKTFKSQWNAMLRQLGIPYESWVVYRDGHGHNTEEDGVRASISQID